MRFGTIPNAITTKMGLPMWPCKKEPPYFSNCKYIDLPESDLIWHGADLLKTAGADKRIGRPNLEGVTPFMGKASKPNDWNS
jgi:hypothetical protein